MLVGRAPFEAKCTKEVLRKISKAQYIMPKTVSLEAQDLINRIFQLEMDDRITIEDIMEHPFVFEEFPETTRIVEAGDLITLGPAPESIEMFLAPQECPEEIQKIEIEPYQSPEKTSTSPDPSKSPIDLPLSPNSLVNHPKDNSIKPKKMKKKNKKSHLRPKSAQKRNISSMISKYTQNNNSSCEIIKEEDEEDESFALKSKNKENLNPNYKKFKNSKSSI